jgi:hypothetical protein
LWTSAQCSCIDLIYFYIKEYIKLQQSSDEDDHHFGDYDEFGLDDETPVIELQTRRHVSGSSGYVQVCTVDEDFEDAHRHQHQRSRGRRKDSHNMQHLSRLQTIRNILPKEPPKGCAKCCAVFSSAAIVFLIILAFLISFNAPYLRLSSEILKSRQELVEAVVGAIFMYIVCLAISLFIIFRSSVRREVEDGRYVN